uniref:Uncharacterized protein n=1 Tax=Trichogramma kaykai TaxID=54128 RepID=A0ABD2WIR5_9HYME
MFAPFTNSRHRWFAWRQDPHGPSSSLSDRAAIALDKLPGLDLAQYVSGVENAVQGAEWVDELQPSQVCLFLASQALAENQHGQNLDIDGHRLSARPLTKVPLIRVLATNTLPLLSDKKMANILLDRHRVEYTIYFGSEEQWCDGCQRVGHSEWSCDEEQLAKYIDLNQTKTIVVPSTKNDDITTPLPPPPTSTEQSGGVVPPIASTSTSETVKNESDTRLKSRPDQRKASPLNTSEQGNSSGNSSTQMQSSLAKPTITVFGVSRSDCPQQTYTIRAVKLLTKEQQKR